MKKILLTLFIILVSVSFALASPFSFKQINKFVSDKIGVSGTNEVDVEIEPFLSDDSGIINSVPPKNNPKAAAIVSEIGQPKNNQKVVRNISTNNRGHSTLRGGNNTNNRGGNNTPIGPIFENTDDFIVPTDTQPGPYSADLFNGGNGVNNNPNNHQSTPVPEPSTILLVGLGLLGVGIVKTRHAFKK
jgi:hypothetical protein